MKGHEHKYIVGTIGDECEFCGLLKTTIEQSCTEQEPDWEEKFARKFCVMIERSQYTEEEIDAIYSFINREIDKARQDERKELREKVEKLSKNKYSAQYYAFEEVLNLLK